MPPIDYTFVVPVFNEEETLRELHRRLEPVLDRLDGPSEVVFVDDGSTDRSREILRSLAGLDARVRVVALSRNFGHQVAISAGLDHARGAAAIIMDADLQDPPEVALELAERWRHGYDIVYAVRASREGESFAKRTSASWFYRILGLLADVEVHQDVGDFRLVDRRVIDAVGGMPERNRYLRGMFAWVGFDQTGVTFSRESRFAGDTKYPLRKMLHLARDALLSFSSAPLRLVLNLGFIVSALAVLLGIVAIATRIFGWYAVPGWASILVAIAFIGGAQLVVLGMLGEYVARIYEEVKQRPLYLVSEVIEDRPADASGELVSPAGAER